MGLACHIGHIGLNHKVIEHSLVALVVWQQHGHLNGKCTVIARCGLCFVHHFFLQASTHVASLPIEGVGHPPVGYTALDGIMHFGTLYGHTGITQDFSLCSYRITTLIWLVVFRKLHLERGALVFLYAETGAGTTGTNGKTAVQQSCGQGKLSSTLAEGIGRHLLLGQQFIVGITQFQFDGLVADCHIVDGRLFFPDNSCHMDNLAGTVDAAVGKQVYMLRIVLTVVIGIASIAIH